MGMTGEQAAELAAVVAPGDTLVLGYAGPMNAEHAFRLKAEAEQRLPGVTVVIMDQVACMAVVRGGTP